MIGVKANAKIVTMDKGKLITEDKLWLIRISNEDNGTDAYVFAGSRDDAHQAAENLAENLTGEGKTELEVAELTIDFLQSEYMGLAQLISV